MTTENKSKIKSSSIYIKNLLILFIHVSFLMRFLFFTPKVLNLHEDWQKYVHQQFLLYFFIGYENAR